MMNLPTVDDTRWSRARSYWNVDGIPTLVGALLYLGCVGCGLLSFWGYKHIDSLKQNWFFDSVIGPIGWLLGATAPFWILAALIRLGTDWEDVIEWFKVRITYPRTGYVAPPSYWQNESIRPAEPERESWLWKVLSALNGFWPWFFLFIILDDQGLMHSRRTLILVLGLLVTIRGIRFGIYPKRPIPEDRTKPGIRRKGVRFIGSVMDSLWVWWISIELLRPLRPAIGHVSPLVLAWFLFALSLVAFFILLPKEGWLAAAGLCLYGIGCAFLLWRNLPVGIGFTLLVPGLWAASEGGLKLHRYLRENPIQSR